jgi:uncharacterized protein (TIGR00661 family)
MTQAIAAAQILERAGHEVVAVTVGVSPGRPIPAFFRQAFAPCLAPIPSPGFSLHAGRGVAGLCTLQATLRGLGNYRRSLTTLGGLIERHRPDLILNFLEPLMGVFNLLRRDPVPVVSVGHHFMLDHPEFVRSRRFAVHQWLMRRYVRLAGARSTRLALSFYPAAPLPERRLSVGPPLLRNELFDLTPEEPGGFLLAYVLNQGYTEDILRWHTEHPEVEVHCFCEKPRVQPVWHYDATLAFHGLDGSKFLRMMAQSRGVACTAGFESLNEAAWLGKPLLVVPVENHVEQYLNALDAAKAGLAMAARRFDLSPLLAARPASNLPAYRSWLARAGTVLLKVVENAVRQAAPRFLPTPAPALPALP